MTVSLRRQWQHFKATPCGRRFYTRHRVRRAQGGGVARKLLISALGGLTVLAGIAMIVLPGPGMLAIALGAAFIAQESLFAARLLDRLDHWATGLYKRWRARRAE
ncbi:MAG: PGPGW domain-containing protein [Rhodanobacter sp.]